MRADWVKSGDLIKDNTLTTLPACTVTVIPNWTYPSNTGYAGWQLNASSSQKFIWRDLDPNVRVQPILASASITLNTKGHSDATIGAAGNASAGVSFSIAPSSGPDAGNYKYKDYGVGKSNQDWYPVDTFNGREVPGTVSSYGNFYPQETPQPDGTKKFILSAGFNIIVVSGVRAHSDSGTSTATNDPTTVTIASITAP